MAMTPPHSATPAGRAGAGARGAAARSAGDASAERRPGRTAARRGRPPRLSRESIVEAALALLAAEPAAALTMSRIAGAAGATPAALYRHFRNLDELLDAVLGAVLGAVESDVRHGEAWPDQLRSWLVSLRQHLLRYPAVLPLIGRLGRTSPAWLEASSVQLAILERAELRGDALALAHLWVLEVTMGLVMQEASLVLPDQIAAARASLPEMSEPARERLGPLMARLGALDGETFFGFAIERTIAALVALVESERGR